MAFMIVFILPFALIMWTNIISELEEYYKEEICQR
jgi:hypothetical protein